MFYLKSPFLSNFVWMRNDTCAPYQVNVHTKIHQSISVYNFIMAQIVQPHSGGFEINDFSRVLYMFMRKAAYIMVIRLYRVFVIKICYASMRFITLVSINYAQHFNFTQQFNNARNFNYEQHFSYEQHFNYNTIILTISLSVLVKSISEAELYVVYVEWLK